MPVIFTCRLLPRGKDGELKASGNSDLARGKTFLAARSDVNAKIGDGGTALILTSQPGHLKVVQALLAANAAMNAKRNDGVTTLIAASLSVNRRLGSVIY